LGYLSGGIHVETSPAGSTDHAVCLVGWRDTTVADVVVVSGFKKFMGHRLGVGGSGYMYISYGSDLVVVMPIILFIMALLT